MRLTRQHFEFMADEVAPLLGWATGVNELADKLQKTNPRFNREKFVKRATNNWEQRYKLSLEEIDDDV